MSCKTLHHLSQASLSPTPHAMLSSHCSPALVSRDLWVFSKRYELIQTLGIMNLLSCLPRNFYLTSCPLMSHFKGTFSGRPSLAIYQADSSLPILSTSTWLCFLHDNFLIGKGLLNAFISCFVLLFLFFPTRLQDEWKPGYCPFSSPTQL